MTCNTNPQNSINAINPKTTCCFSGHRVIASNDRAIIDRNLPLLLEKLYTESGIHTFIAGGAFGFDTLAATAVLRLRKRFPDIRLILALPCKNQSERWTGSQKVRYNQMLSSADEILYISESYTPYCMHKRNRFMVDNSSTVIVYIQNTASGTGYTTKYALDNDRNVLNVLAEV